MLKLAAFDLDGTIADTLPLCIQAFQQGVSPYAGRMLTEAEITALFGHNEVGMIQKLAPGHCSEALKSYYAAYAQLHDQCPQPFEGVLPFISTLKENGMIVSMITGKAEESCWVSLRRFHMEDVFDDVLTGSPLGNNKRERLLQLMQKHGLTAQECIYIGDAVADVSAAHAAGVSCLSAAWFDSADVAALQAVNPGLVFPSVAAMQRHLLQLLKAL